MNKTVNIGNKQYVIADNQEIDDIDEEIVFELSIPEDGTVYVVGVFDDLLGQPIKKVWKIISTSKLL
jgi:hypothetical protein